MSGDILPKMSELNQMKKAHLIRMVLKLQEEIESAKIIPKDNKKPSEDDFINICGFVLTRRKNIHHIIIGECISEDLITVEIYSDNKNFRRILVPKEMSSSFEKLIKDLT